jgi:hypothetical protein
MLGTLSRPRAKLGSEVWSVYFQGSTSPWRVGLVGRVQRLTSEGPIVAGKQLGWTEYPLFHTREECAAFAKEHPPSFPGVSGLVER